MLTSQVDSVHLSEVLRVLRTLRFFRELRLMLDCVLGSVINAIWPASCRTPARGVLHSLRNRKNMRIKERYRSALLPAYPSSLRCVAMLFFARSRGCTDQSMVHLHFARSAQVMFIFALLMVGTRGIQAGPTKVWNPNSSGARSGRLPGPVLAGIWARKPD